jgi:hypothetical protein
VALLTVFSDNLSPITGNLSTRFSKAIGFFIDAPLTEYELEIDVFIQIYIPTSTGEITRNLPLSTANPLDTETMITIPSEYVDSGLEMALLFLASSNTYLEAYVIGAACTLCSLDSKLNQITQLITDMSLFLQDSTFNSLATSTTTASVAVVSNTATISLLAANPNRKRFSLRNKGNKAALIGFSSTFTTANFYLSLAAGAVYESDFSFTGEIFGLAVATNSATDIQVTEFI